MKTLICLGLLFIQSSLVFAQKVMTPGGWEFTVESVITDKQGGQRKSNKTSAICLSKSVLAQDIYLDPKFELGNLLSQGGKCEVFDQKRQPNSATFKISCAMPGNVKLSTTYQNEASAEQFKSDVARVMVNDPRGVEMVNQASAKFIGACTSEMSRPEVRARPQ
jgi:Protein of unknown function (DUF3617)